MPSHIVISGNKLVLKSDNSEDFQAAMDFAHAAIFVYKLERIREASPYVCLYKIASENPSKFHLLIEDTSGELDLKTGNYKGIDQFLASNPPYEIIKNDALPCMQTLSLESTRSVEEAKIGFKS